jgi:hypothetical protein
MTKYCVLLITPPVWRGASLACQARVPDLEPAAYFLRVVLSTPPYKRGVEMTVSCTTPSGFDPLFAVRSTKGGRMSYVGSKGFAVADVLPHLAWQAVLAVLSTQRR